MKNVIIYGATDTGKKIYKSVKSEYKVLCFVDENPALTGNKIDGIEIRETDVIYQVDFDFIIIAVLSKYLNIQKELLEKGIDEKKIITQYVDLPNRARNAFVFQLSTYFKELNMEGAIAEVGVYQGEFSKIIGEGFKDNIFYLFDTFEGFSEKDVLIEQENCYSSAKIGYFSNVSVNNVLEKIPNNTRCRVKKGYFPETAADIDDQFIFVNLDADLYKPTLDGLRFFWKRMKMRGVILVHDYFSEIYRGIKKAVDEFCQEEKIYILPIGDTLSIAIIKNEFQGGVLK